MNDPLLSPAEAGTLLGVHPKTITRWARAGKITALITPGGHRRFRRSDIVRYREQMEAGWPAGSAR